MTAPKSGGDISQNGDKDIEIWLVDLKASLEALEAIELKTPQLAPGDFAPGDLAAHPSHNPAVQRAERRAAHIALRILIDRLLGPHWRGVAFEIGPTGKPLLPQPMLLGASPAEVGRGDFSLSHSSGHALIAVSKGRAVGVDLEGTRPLRMSLERRQRIIAAGRRLSPGYLPGGESDADVLQAWVSLEAFAKMDGRGIGRVLTSMGVMGGAKAVGSAMATQAATGVPMQGRPFTVQDVALGKGLFAAVAVEGRSGPAEVLDFPSRRADIEALLV